ncbi:MAG: filamentation induced by cAMP protein fic, partial [Saccharospirillaceae bacterium]|nr:filamentation induced by cAMP protein fic [Saccharospirillaceae bacterium]
LTRQQLAQIVSKEIRTIARALAKLQQTGKIKRVGSDKIGYWEVEGN